ncbi:MAG: putative toxin-antitoxin system toxin component, PIN family [Thermoguttaceae bacterium]
MRVLCDTNVLVSALLSLSSVPGRVVEEIICNHTFILPTFVVVELTRVFEKKFPDLLPALSVFLNQPDLHTVDFSPNMFSETPYLYDVFSIRDPNDEPVLLSAIQANVDVLITGDKDFFDLVGKVPFVIMTPNDFLHWVENGNR